jgi:hypothetical protein
VCQPPTNAPGRPWLCFGRLIRAAGDFTGDDHTLQHHPLTLNQRERISCCSFNRLQSKKSVLMIPPERPSP